MAYVKSDAPAAGEGPVASHATTPDLITEGGERLSWLERANIRFVRSSFTSRPFAEAMSLGQRTLGAGWVDYCTRNIRQVYGVDRLPPPEALPRFILATNHRSYFDLFVCSMVLIKHGYKTRMMYPVRSGFFYDHPAGVVVNFAMSFLSMYPPIFRDRKRATLNKTGLMEIAWLFKKHGFGLGIHPEGTRNTNGDPYSFLPAQSGVGRIIRASSVPVVPAFINGLGNDLPKQVAGNFNRRGEPIIVVFGAPIEYGPLINAPSTGRTFRALAERTLVAIGELGDEERAIREQLRNGG